MHRSCRIMVTGGFQDLARQSLAWRDLVVAIGPLWEGGQTRCPLRSLLVNISKKYYNTLQVKWVTSSSYLLHKMQKWGKTVSSDTVLQIYIAVDFCLPTCRSEWKLGNDTIGTNHSWSDSLLLSVRISLHVY